MDAQPRPWACHCEGEDVMQHPYGDGRVAAVDTRLALPNRLVRLARRAMLLLAAGLLAGVPAAAEEPFAVGRLWQVDAPGVPPSYVFGTFHLPDPRVAPLPPSVTTLLPDIEILAVELLPEQLAGLDPSFPMLPDGQGLDDLVAPEIYAALAEMAAERGLPATVVQRMRPVFATTLLGLPRDVLLRHLTGRPGVDQILVDLASQRGIRVVPLERIEEQLKAFAIIDNAGPEMLADFVAQRDALPAVYEGMVESYLSGEILHFTRDQLSLLGGGAVDDRIVAALLYNRNRRMVDRMEPILQRGHAMIAVGAMHVPGANGILDLLAQRGYTVTRLD